MSATEPAIPSLAPPCFVTHYRVQFGDCDPANIVYFPNFYRWFDQATHALCEAAGYELVHVRSALAWVGFPIAEAGARFLRPATINDLLRIETRVREWQPRRFLLEHRILRDDTLLVEGWQTRFIGVQRAERGGRLAALEIPPAFRTAVDAQMAAGAA
ncbi:MAG: acyl-CoA thioesterase [Lautropia sp.]